MTASNLIAKWPTWAPQLRSVLRIVAAFMFIQAGTMKLFAFPAGMPREGWSADENIRSMSRRRAAAAALLSVRRLSSSLRMHGAWS